MRTFDYLLPNGLPLRRRQGSALLRTLNRCCRRCGCGLHAVAVVTEFGCGLHAVVVLTEFGRGLHAVFVVALVFVFEFGVTGFGRGLHALGVALWDQETKRLQEVVEFCDVLHNVNSVRQ